MPVEHKHQEVYLAIAIHTTLVSNTQHLECKRCALAPAKLVAAGAARLSLPDHVGSSSNFASCSLL